MDWTWKPTSGHIQDFERFTGSRFFVSIPDPVNSGYWISRFEVDALGL